MRKINRIITLICLLGSAAQAADLEALWRHSRGERFVPASPPELRQAERLFGRVLAGEQSDQLTQDWAALGFELEPISVDAQPMLALRERPARREGRGFFLFAPARRDAMVLQTPHGYSDLHTGRIGLRLFKEGRFSAGAWNTVPRRYREQGRMVEADFTDHSGSYLLAFARATVNHQPAVQTLQLHGFATVKRRTEAGRSAGFIVSAGERVATPAAQRLSDCLRQRFSDPVRLYPLTVSELGGTTNPVGQALRALGNRGFLHLELAPGVRQRLLNEPAARSLLLDCL